MTTPAPIDDPVLGPCTWDARVNWYQYRPFGQHPEATLNIKSLTYPSLAAAIQEAREVVDKSEDLIAQGKTFAAAKLLEIYNSVWRDEGQPAIDAAGFIACMTLQDVVVSMHRLTLYYNDGDLFLGHCIEIRIRPDGTISEACVSG